MLFFDITKDRLSFTKDKNDLLVIIDNDKNQGIKIKDHFLNDEYALDYIQALDGYAISKEDIDNIVNAFDKPSLNDKQDGTITDSTNDEILQGSTKDNIYYYSGGKDMIIDNGGIDTLKFMISGHNLNFSTNGSDLSLSLKSMSDANNKDIITIKDFFTNTNAIIENIELKSGYRFSAKDIYQSFGMNYPDQSQDQSQSLDQSQDQSQSQNPSQDQTNTTTTSDSTQANEDIFVGGNEDNNYVFNGGNKTIIDSGGNDTIKFNQNGNGLNFLSNGKDLTLNVYSHPNDTITITDFFVNPNNIVENFELNNGGVITAKQVYELFGKEYPSLQNIANKIIQDLNSYSNDNATNFSTTNENKNNVDFMQLYNA